MVGPNLEKQHGRVVCALDSGSEFTSSPRAGQLCGLGQVTWPVAQS